MCEFLINSFQEKERSGGLPFFIVLFSSLHAVAFWRKPPAVFCCRSLPQHCEFVPLNLHWCHFHFIIFSHEHCFNSALFNCFTITSRVCLNLFFCLKYTRLFTVFALFIILCFCCICVSVCRGDGFWPCACMFMWGFGAFMRWADALPPRVFGTASWTNQEREKNKDA